MSEEEETGESFESCSQVQLHGPTCFTTWRASLSLEFSVCLFLSYHLFLPSAPLPLFSLAFVFFLVFSVLNLKAEEVESSYFRPFSHIDIRFFFFFLRGEAIRNSVVSGNVKVLILIFGFSLT